MPGDFRKLHMIEDTIAPCDPSTDRTAEDNAGIETEIAEMRGFAVEIARTWIAPESGVELIEQQRR